MLSTHGIGVTPETLTMFKTVSVNLKQDCIIVTRDKLELVLRDHLAVVENRGRWAAPAALCVSTLLAMATADFKERLYLSADFWRAVFALVAVGSAVRASIFGWKHWRTRSTIQTVIKSVVAAGGVVQFDQTPTTPTPMTSPSTGPQAESPKETVT